MSVECRPQFAAERSLRLQVQQQLEHSIKSLLGITCVVRVCEPGAIERSAGKARRVIDPGAEARPAARHLGLLKDEALSTRVR